MFKDYLRKLISQNGYSKRALLLLWRILSPLINIINLSVFPRYVWFINEWRKYKNAGGNAPLLNLYPCLLDTIDKTKFDSQYFYQAVWAFKKIIRQSPDMHIDVGSDLRFVSMLSAITNTIFVDIRPIDVNLENFTSVSGSILSLPYKNDDVQSLSCLHVIEHIGLGRYGDPIDPDGTKKACKELERVLAPAGNLYITAPINNASGKSVQVCFNGQRVFSIQEVLSYFTNLEVVEFGIVDGQGSYIPNHKLDAEDIKISEFSDFVLGMFVLQKVLKI